MCALCTFAAASTALQPLGQGAANWFEVRGPAAARAALGCRDGQQRAALRRSPRGPPADRLRHHRGGLQERPAADEMRRHALERRRRRPGALAASAGLGLLAIIRLDKVPADLHRTKRIWPWDPAVPGVCREDMRRLVAHEPNREPIEVEVDLRCGRRCGAQGRGQRQDVVRREDRSRAGRFLTQAPRHRTASVNEQSRGSVHALTRRPRPTQSRAACRQRSAAGAR